MKKLKNELKSAAGGFLASLILILLYFSVLTFVSGWPFALSQFFSFWYFIITLAAGFGIQVGLYLYLRNAVKNQSKKTLVASGTTSAAAMISCCSHYLVNLLPIIGVTGIITVVAQYQIQIFWLAIVFNVLGILYMLKNLRRLKLI
ncbi:MAG: hypothetical protein M1405_03475 [Patescibacteria group bacterium]|nr:hypothetical protein [Patescibacteria group bacterium]